MWLGGKTTLYTVDLRDMSILKIKNLLPEVMLGQGSTPEPMYVLADFDKEKYIATYFYTDEFVLSYLEKNREADIHLMSDIFPKVHEVTCMDLDREKTFAFIGGNTVKEDTAQYSAGTAIKRKAIVSAFTFNKDLKIIANLELPEDRCSIVGSIRVSPTHENVIYVNTDGPLFILGLDPVQKRFRIIKALKERSQGE